MLDRPRQWISLAHFLVRSASLAVIFASVGSLISLVVFDERVEKFTLGLRPVQFLGVTEEDILANHTDIFGVGHNSGDTIGTAVQALVHGADVIEIDVVMADGRLYAGHNAPNRIFGRTSFLGSPLSNAWVVASAAGAIQLDLKHTSDDYIELVSSFIATRQRFPALIISSSNLNVLQSMSESAPNAVLLLSIGSPNRLDALRDEEAAIALIDGVSIREDLVTEDSVDWLKDEELQIWAWTVNRPTRAAELAALEVDGITTDNLAILDALSGGGPDDREVAPRSIASAAQEPAERGAHDNADHASDD